MWSRAFCTSCLSAKVIRVGSCLQVCPLPDNAMLISFKASSMHRRFMTASVAGALELYFLSCCSQWHLPAAIQVSTSAVPVFIIVHQGLLHCALSVVSGGCAKRSLSQVRALLALNPLSKSPVTTVLLLVGRLVLATLLDLSVLV